MGDLPTGTEKLRKTLLQKKNNPELVNFSYKQPVQGPKYLGEMTVMEFSLRIVSVSKAGNFI